MAGSFFDNLFAAGARPIHDATFGQLWNFIPMAKVGGVNNPAEPDTTRPKIDGLIGIFTDKDALYKATHVYDLQTDKRPGVMTATDQVEFSALLPDGSTFSVAPSDQLIRIGDTSIWRVNTVQRDDLTGRYTCGIGRLS